MQIQFLHELSKNLRRLVEESGLPMEDYARSKKLPKKLLEELLAGNHNESSLAATLALLSDRLGFTVGQLLTPDLSVDRHNSRFALPQTGPPPFIEIPDHLLARQLGRLIEDFVECDEAGRFEVTALAQELAEERLRRTGRAPAPKPSKAPGPSP